MPIRTSEGICADLVKHPSGEWADMTQHKLAATLRDFNIRPFVWHPTGSASVSRGAYRYKQLEPYLERLLQKPVDDSNSRTFEPPPVPPEPSKPPKPSKPPSKRKRK